MASHFGACRGQKWLRMAARNPRRSVSRP
jgi:hypothetical protein